jgi:hypothetical protein
MSNAAEEQLASSFIFKQGLGETNTALTEEKKRELYGGDVVDLFRERIPDNLHEMMSLEEFSLVALQWAPSKIGLYLDSLESITEISLDPLQQIAKLVRREMANTATQLIASLPDVPGTEPGVIDGWMAAIPALVEPLQSGSTITLQKDRWGYAVAGLGQSYDTVPRSGLCSTTTAKELTGDTVHFMMFEEGDSKVEIHRFSFPDNPLLANPSAQGSPMDIVPSFCNTLGLTQAVTDRLPMHAKRLATAQHILERIAHQEIHTQALFQHCLSSLISSIDESSSCRVMDVTGMTSAHVSVQVCNKYLENQGKEPVDGNGKFVSLRIKSDLVVRNRIKSDLVVSNSKEKEDKLQSFLHCRYNIEMKDAFGVLKHSAIKPKSQLIAESMARDLKLVMENRDEAPRAIYSVLCDVCCLHVLVYFPFEKKAYLSHREVEPGRMVCVLAWVHSISTQDKLSVQKFLEMGLNVSGSFIDEVKASQKKRGIDPDEADGQSSSARSDRSQQQLRYVKKRSASMEHEMCIDVVASEKQEAEREEQTKLDTFSLFQNYYHFGDPLPLTEGVLSEMERKERLQSKTVYESTLGRVGLK